MTINQFQLILADKGIKNLPSTNRNKYRKAISELLNMGVTPTLDRAEPFKKFGNTPGANFQYKLSLNGKCVYFGRGEIRYGIVKDEYLSANPERYADVSKYRKEQLVYNPNTGKDEKYTGYEAKYVNVPSSYTSWMVIAQCMYKIAKSVLIVEKCNCSKCGGSGFIPAYKHIANGICFDCWGTGGEFKLNKDALLTELV